MIVRGADELAAKTDRIAGRLEHPSGAEPQLTDAMQASLRRAFETGGFGAWASHAPATDERWGAHAVMRLSGALEAALTGGRAQATGTQIVYRPSGDPGSGRIATGRRPVTVDPVTAAKAAEAINEYAFRGET